MLSATSRGFLPVPLCEPPRARDTSNIPIPQDLSRATKLTLKADANELPLSSLLSHVPGLLELNLNGSILTSPRDIGSGLSRLRVLWVCRCSLPTLQGLGSLSCLEELYASFNDIQDLSPLGGK